MIASLTVKEALAFITGAGFSMFVAVWYMLKTEQTLDELVITINQLAIHLRNCN